MRIVKLAAYLGGHRLAVTFDDGVTKLIDLAPHIHGEIFEPLSSPEFFAKFQVDADTDTITWPNGADFSPDWLYSIGADANSLTHSA